MTIRNTLETDIPAIAELEQTSFPDPWSAKGLRDTLAENSSFFLSAEENGVLCGYLNTTWVLDELNLNRICVHPDFRRKGIAEQLMAALKDFCRKNQIAHIFLEVRESNQPARSLYLSENFKELGKRPRFYDHPTEDAVLMECSIS